MDGWEGNMPDYWYLLWLFLLVGLLLETCWVALVDFIYTTHEHWGQCPIYVWGYICATPLCLVFNLCAKFFEIFFAILPYLSMLCLWRLFFTWYSEELCIFANVRFILTPCYLGCHWTKCVNLFLLMLSEWSKIAWRLRINSGDSREDHKHSLKKHTLSCKHSLFKHSFSNTHTSMFWSLLH